MWLDTSSGIEDNARQHISVGFCFVLFWFWFWLLAYTPETGRDGICISMHVGLHTVLLGASVCMVPGLGMVRNSHQNARARDHIIHVLWRKDGPISISVCMFPGAGLTLGKQKLTCTGRNESQWKFLRVGETFGSKMACIVLECPEGNAKLWIIHWWALSGLMPWPPK